MIYRVGRAPEPREWPPANLDGRYSHPDGAVRVLYGATERLAAYLETLQAFRPAIADLARFRDWGGLPSDFPGEADLGVIPGAYFDRRIAAFQVAEAERILNLCAPETHARLRQELAVALVACGYSGAFNFGEVIGTDYRLTQLITHWAHEHDFTGVAYPSAHDHTLTCWAVFDSAQITFAGEPESIERDDPDLLAAAALFGLRV